MKPLLEKLREEIREKDREIVRLLNERARISVRIGQVKGQEGLAVYDPVQEAKVLDDLNTLNEGPLSDRQVSSINLQIISASRDLQKPVAVAFLGPEASFSHLAARLHFGAAGRFVPERTLRASSTKWKKAPWTGASFPWRIRLRVR
jgi:chorismate mutase/prephenate dehydratase